VSMHAALACNTTRVRCGCLVYSVGYRHPAVLANAIATIDHLSGGRADIGVGGGWSQVEYDAYGIPFPPVGVRLRQLEEGAACVRGLLRNERTTFEGEYFQLRDAQCEPRPVQDELPIWIGGGGEKKTLRVAAKYADGWNVPFIAPDAYRHKVSVLHQHCEDVGRDPSEIRLSINVWMAASEDDLRAQFGNIANFVRPGVLMGSDQEILDKVAAYEEAGAQQINIAMRAPWDVEGLERLASALPLG
jgi:alkanesulfonate monooxygenase SsuD/methylene tetrahydromethanopterin reductase-like flavin-dependent oxidoreductase (luciferase family)